VVVAKRGQSLPENLHPKDGNYPELPLWSSGLRIVRFFCPRNNEFATRAGSLKNRGEAKS
jgi:hypothetical protein